jgi:phosphoserine phosphatase RsbU/P
MDRLAGTPAQGGGGRMSEVFVERRRALPGRLLPALADLSQRLALSLDLEGTLRQAVALIAESMQAEAAAVFLVEGSDLVCRACAGPVDVTGLRLPRGQGIVGRAVASGQCEIVRDAQTDPDFAGRRLEAEGSFVTRTVLCAPLLTAEGAIGALQVINKRNDQRFDENDSDALRLLAAPTALALNRARLADALLEQNRIQRELTMARRLQRSLLPRRRRGAYPLRALNLPAREISGDFYDFFDLPDGRIAFTVGDVAGKGLDAAFLMVRCASLLRWAGKEGLRPSEWLARANDELCEAIPPGMFVCTVAGYYDPATAAVVWASAGFPPLLRIDASGRSERFLAEGPPLGILHGMQFPEQQCDLHDTVLYMFSDGLTDVRDADDRMLDVDGVEAALSDGAIARPEARVRALVRQLRRMRISDDTTLMLIQGPPSGARQLLQHCFRAQPQALAHMRHRAGTALQLAGVGSAQRQELVLALDEAASNVIRHGYGGPCEEDITLRIVLDGGELRFELTDRAPCASPDCMQPRDLGECRPGGLGINIIDATMDHWELAPLPDCGNRLSMRKRIRAH